VEDKAKLQSLQATYPHIVQQWKGAAESMTNGTYDNSLSMKSLSVAPRTIFFSPGQNDLQKGGIPEVIRSQKDRKNLSLIVSPLETRSVQRVNSDGNLRTRRVSLTSLTSEASIMPLKANPETSTVNATVTVSLPRSPSVSSTQNKGLLSSNPQLAHGRRESFPDPDNSHFFRMYPDSRIRCSISNLRAITI
jgi:hypothetical protein